MKSHKLRELYLMLRHRPDSGANRGREFYDGMCQTCHSPEYETHTDDCAWMDMLIRLGGDEEQVRQSAMKTRRDDERAEHAKQMELRRMGKAAPRLSLEEMSAALKETFGQLPVASFNALKRRR